mgnify:CR=1 FL=1
MSKIIDISNLPTMLPIFPLPGAIVLPSGILPLNIFEPRYLAMVDSVLGSHRMIGMIQPKEVNDSTNGLYPVGCGAKIVSFSETADNRYIIELKGIVRFHIITELESSNGFRIIKPNWILYKRDLKLNFENINTTKLLHQLKVYFDKNNLNVDFDQISKIPSEQIIAAIPQICSFKPNEKQAILEAMSEQDIVEVLISLLKMNLAGDNNNEETIN